MRLEIPFFPSRAACRGEICLMMPRRHHFVGDFASRPVADRALFRLLAGHRHHLAGLLRRDLRRPSWAGTSSRRSLTDRSASATACQPIQRMRQQRTVSTLTPRSRAIWLLFFPASGRQDDASSQRQLLGGAVPTHQQLQFVSLNIAQGQWFRFGASHWLGPLSFNLEVPVYYRSISASMY